MNEGVTLSTVGVGMGNYNDVLMEQLANDGDGNYIYIDNLTEAWKSFVDNLTSTLQVIARDAKIQVSFNPDVVHSYRLIGYENRDVADRDFRNDSVDAGEVGAGHSVTALYELRLHERIDGPRCQSARAIRGTRFSSDLRGGSETSTSTTSKSTSRVRRRASSLRRPWPNTPRCSAKATGHSTRPSTTCVITPTASAASSVTTLK